MEDLAGVTISGLQRGQLAIHLPSMRMSPVASHKSGESTLMIPRPRMRAKAWLSRVNKNRAKRDVTEPSRTSYLHSCAFWSGRNGVPAEFEGVT